MRIRSALKEQAAQLLHNPLPKGNADQKNRVYVEIDGNHRSSLIVQFDLGAASIGSRVHPLVELIPEPIRP
jgi:hypothetical protein